jgi:hypothetical protein
MTIELYRAKNKEKVKTERTKGRKAKGKVN